MIIKIALDTASPNRVADIAQVIESTLGLLPEQAIVVVEQGGLDQNPGTQDGTRSNIITVGSQAAFDAAFETLRDDPEATIVIDAPSGTWIRVSGSHSCGVEARGESSVEALDSTYIVAWDWSYVKAWDTSRVVARDSSYVEARDKSLVVAWDTSHVEARGSSYVYALDSSSVEDMRGL